MKVKACILTGYGLNCDIETQYSFKIAGAFAERIHINELIWNKELLKKFHILAFVGGFSWADDHGAGLLLALKMKNHLMDQIQKFIDDGKLIIGICNGFQTLVNMGLLPATEMYWKREAALISNDSGNFIDRWVMLKVNRDSPCIFTKGLDEIELPIRHAEGKFYARRDVLKRIVEGNQIVLQYKENPNGSLLDIAAVCDRTGRIFGLMPHPEAFNHPTNHPDWTRRKISKAFGIEIFRNAVSYVKENLL